MPGTGRLTLEPRPMKKPAKSTKKSAAAPAAIDPAFAPVAKAFAKDRQVTCGKMMSSVGLKVSGKIFAMHVRGRLVVKLPKPRVDELVAAGAGEYFDPRRDGRLMKEWIVVTDPKLNWIKLAKEAHQFVNSALR